MRHAVAQVAVEAAQQALSGARARPARSSYGIDVLGEYENGRGSAQPDGRGCSGSARSAWLAYRWRRRMARASRTMRACQRLLSRAEVSHQAALTSWQEARAQQKQLMQDSAHAKRTTTLQSSAPGVNAPSLQTDQTEDGELLPCPVYDDTHRALGQQAWSEPQLRLPSPLPRFPSSCGRERC